jgi:hypothetical protein
MHSMYLITYLQDFPTFLLTLDNILNVSNVRLIFLARLYNHKVSLKNTCFWRKQQLLNLIIKNHQYINQTPNLIRYLQGRHGRVLAGKDAIVVATSPSRIHCYFLFLKIQPRTKPWLPCLPWRPWYIIKSNLFINRIVRILKCLMEQGL